MEFSELRERALRFREDLLARKEKISAESSQEFAQNPAAESGSSAPDWYPYDTMANIFHLEALLGAKAGAFAEQLAGQRIADMGAADGDFGFFLEAELGCQVDLIDYAPTNYNKLQGAHTLIQELSSRAELLDINLDAQFQLPEQGYHTVFFLGLLYHLKNPFFVLEELSAKSQFCYLSTRIAEKTADQNTRLAEIPLAYLLDPTETNNDPTNFWIFSLAGLRRLCARTGWEILELTTVGCQQGSDPSSPDRDQRAFALLRSQRV